VRELHRCAPRWGSNVTRLLESSFASPMLFAAVPALEVAESNILFHPEFPRCWATRRSPEGQFASDSFVVVVLLRVLAVYSHRRQLFSQPNRFLPKNSVRFHFSSRSSPRAKISLRLQESPPERFRGAEPPLNGHKRRFRGDLKALQGSLG